MSMRKQIMTIVGLGLLMLLFAASASATVISYGIGGDAATLESTMLTHFYVNQTETFDTLAAGSSVTIFGSEVGPFSGYGTVSDTPAGGMFATSGANYFTSNFNGSVSRNFSFSLGTPSGGGDYEAVGFYVTGFDTTKSFNVTLSYADGSVETFDLGNGYTSAVGVGVPIYFGFVGDKLISGITFSNVQDQYAIDNVSAMNTPVPGAVWLLGTGLLGLLGYRRMSR
jgi:hypothetical protein